ncbi:pyridoxamine 5'-phosphate oxidase family protein [Halorussus halophilus]|uniref:pyridoxamine 5'-phosphate oxidase family protein n=1 Tax=Halorussus halophilus TaxID=2650975 RepID=UPI00130133A4|nr:pyridoxamine 5'-phosphate oxidase family protein [Halorussus halophilus]
MEHVEYIYTFGMDESELDELLRVHDVGVLSLADGDDAYAVPVSYDYDGDSLVLRLGQHEDSTKMEFLEATETATFVVHESGDGSWSILARGPLRERTDFDETRINQRFSKFRLFREPVEDVQATVYELEIEELTGRRAD